MNPADFDTALQRELEPFEGTLGLCVLPLEPGAFVVLEHRADQIFPAASTIKLPLLIEALRQVEAGTLTLGQRVLLERQDQVSGAGVLHELQPGLSLSLQDLLTLMIVVSDNTATNLVIDLLGIETVNAFLRPYPHSELIGKLQLPRERQNDRQRSGERNRSSPRDLSTLLLELHHGHLLGPQMSALALSILERQQYKDMVGRSLPRDAHGDLAVRVCSKSGEIGGTRNDTALVYGPIPYAISILTVGGADPREHPENSMVLLGARVSRLVWDWLERHSP